LHVWTIHRFEWRKRFAQGSPPFALSRSRMRSRTGLASPVENQACGIAKYPRLRVHRHEVRMTPAKRRSIYRRGQTGSKGNWLRTQNAEAALSRIGFPGCASRARGRHWSVSVTHRFLRRGCFLEELILGFRCDFFAGFFGEDAREDRVDVAQVAL
jgi:hypothetical protein